MKKEILSIPFYKLKYVFQVFYEKQKGAKDTQWLPTKTNLSWKTAKKVFLANFLLLQYAYFSSKKKSRQMTARPGHTPSTNASTFNPVQSFQYNRFPVHINE